MCRHKGILRFLPLLSQRDSKRLYTGSELPGLFIFTCYSPNRRCIQVCGSQPNWILITYDCLHQNFIPKPFYHGNFFFLFRTLPLEWCFLFNSSLLIFYFILQIQVHLPWLDSPSLHPKWSHHVLITLTISHHHEHSFSILKIKNSCK